MPEYQSSEEVKRQSLDVFANEKAKAAAKKAEHSRSERDKAKKIVDKYIKIHSSTKSVRAEAKKNSRTNDYQLDLSADIVEVLEKVKGELG